MKLQYKVSVIIPAYNVRPYIEECLNSVLHQTLSDIEVIVVDDGSTDGTAEYLDQYALQYVNHLNVVHQTNAGVSAARNVGIKAAKGKYIYFLDGDDYIELDAMKNLYEIAEENNLDLILFSGDNFYYNNENHCGISPQCRLIQHKYADVSSGQELFAALIEHNEYYGVVYLSFIHRMSLITYHTIFNQNISYCEDFLFLFVFFLSCNRTSAIPQVLHHYRQARPDSLVTRRNYAKTFLGYNALLKQIEQVIQDGNLQSAAARAAVIQYMGNIYSGIITYYDMLTLHEKRDVKDYIVALKKIAKGHHYFGSIKCLIFQISKTGFHIVRSICKQLRGR